MRTRLADRIAGCLLGGAVGDALAAPFENGPPGQAFTPPADLWVTDDTQLTLATCEAVIEPGGVTPEAVAEKLTDWYKMRRLTGLGAATLAAVRTLEAGGHWATAAVDGARADGNGAAVRAAPLAFLLDPVGNEADRTTLRDVCSITHRGPEARAGAAMVLAVRAAATGTPRAFLPGAVADGLAACGLGGSSVADRVRLVRHWDDTVRAFADRFGAGGWAVQSVPLDLLAAVRGGDFVATVGEVVACGGDADSVAAMAGQIVGTLGGTAAIPADLTGRVEHAAKLRAAARTLAALSHLRG